MPNNKAAGVEAATAGAEIGQWGVDLQYQQESVKPGDDFFQYANGDWLDSFEIPAEYSNYGSFTMLLERSEARLGEIIDSARNAKNPTVNERKIADYYEAFLDQGAIDARGAEAFANDLAYFDALQTHEDVAAAFTRPGLLSASPITPYVYIDQKQPDRYLVHVTQSGLGMPGREYYLEDRYASQKAQYRNTIGRVLDLAGARKLADAESVLLDLETRIAAIHWPISKQRDPNLTYNLVSKEELETQYAEFPWAVLFASAGIEGQDEFVLNESDAIQTLGELFRQTPVETWREYLKFHYLIAHTSVLPSEIDDAVFQFYGTTLSGQQEQKDRRKRAIEAVSGALGEAVGEIYVTKYFPPQAKQQMNTLIDNVIDAFDERIDGLEWMSEETKVEAKDKLQKFRPFIGGPEKWRDYSALEVSSNDALENLKRANEADWRYYANRLGKPVDAANEWGMTPDVVNAYYSPPRNGIYFPAAILQPPFFDPEADPAVNYGGIGAVIGHEIGHGFDDQGRKSDGDGRLRNWWTAGDEQRFTELTDRLGEQFAEYEPVPGMKIDPALTMGENVGDIGGMAVAYYAYRKSLGGKEAPILNGYTGDQRFFLGYAQIWKRKYRAEDMKWRMVADPHSPAEYRVNGIVRNMDAWYEAFNVKPEDALYLPPEERVQIW
ncbi:M13 family metallopeptidase [Hyphococcus sp.]|uniref:M13 family metallopeptidase n=1 Tax=Hyphococcus sp. TaxID=2038636 RepID=UPI0035C69B2A